MKSRYVISTDEARRNCILDIESLDTEGRRVVTIMDQKEARSAAQSRLRWLWAGQAAKDLAGVGKGRDKEQWNLYWKHRFMKPLLIAQDEDFAIFFEDHDDHCVLIKDHPAVLQDYQTQFWELIAQTEKMNVKTFSEFLDTIDRFMLHEYGLRLDTPADLKYIINGE